MQYNGPATYNVLQLLRILTAEETPSSLFLPCSTLVAKRAVLSTGTAQQTNSACVNPTPYCC